MLHSTRNLVEDWRKGDAEKLARLHTEARVAWPWGGDWQTTPEEEERGIRESNLIGAFVTEDRRRLISICTLRARPDQKDHAFIPFLNCHPDYHGKKHGKSVLAAAVERAFREGYGKVDLYTWPGNLKAVPLYKKMGFMWQPDSAVHMENLTLAARRHPLGAAYFARHDWYATHVRTLELKEDLMKRGEVRVYEYLWRAEDGEFLRMVFDRQSWGVIEVENNDLLVSCRLPDEKLVAGIPHPVSWRIVNHGRDPVRILLSASGDPGVQVRKHEALQVKDAVDLEGTFLIDPAIPEKARDPKAAFLRTGVTVNDLSFDLVAGIDAQQAVSVSLDAPRSILTPGVPRNAVLTLRSNLSRKCTARLSVAPAGNAQVLGRSFRVPLPAKGGAEVSVPLMATEAGPLALNVETCAVAGRERVPVRTRRIDLLAVAPGGVSAGVGEDAAILCGGGLTVYAGLKGGDLAVCHRLRAARAYRLSLSSPRIGPPFSWEDLFQEKAEAAVESRDGGVEVRLRTRSILRPGVILDRRIRLGQGPIVTLTDTLLNGSAVPLDLSLSQGWNARLGPRSELVLPREDGIYRGAPPSGGGRGLEDLNLPQEGDRWPEGWICVQGEEGCAVGVLWDRAERVEPGYRGSLRRKAGRIPPGGTATLAPLHLFVGDGTWQTVRGWWRTLVRGDVPEDETPHTPLHRPIEMGIEPAPLILKGVEAEATLFLRTPGDYQLDGKLVLAPPAGLHPDIRAVGVSRLCRARPVKRKFRLSAPKKPRPGPQTLGVRFETSEAVYRTGVRVLRLVPDAPGVRVSREGRVFALDNGILTVRIAPDFLGSVVSLMREGREFLNSAYPEPRIRGAQNPWHGGVSPAYGRLWGSLHKETFRGRVVGRKGRQGLVWRGVRVECAIRQEHARGHAVALDYLLAPGADVLAILPSCRDVLGVRSGGTIAFTVCPAFAESPGTASFHTPAGESITPLAAPHWSGAGAWDWGAVVGRDGRALFLSARGEGATASGESWGDSGCGLHGGVDRPMPAGGKVEGLFFLAPVFGTEEVKAHTVWSEFEELP